MRITSRMPSIKTRRSNGWVRKLGLINGGVDGLDDWRVIVPLDCGFIIRQMAPK
jgi:hypothetical protein